MSRWKLGSMVRINGLFHLLITWDTYIYIYKFYNRYNPLIQSPLIPSTSFHDFHPSWWTPVRLLRDVKEVWSLAFPPKDEAALKKIHQKLHRTESPPKKRSVSCDRANRYSGEKGSVDQRVLLEISWIEATFWRLS